MPDISVHDITPAAQHPLPHQAMGNFGAYRQKLQSSNQINPSR